ncbi:hypothetical protein A2690_03180 [Candidatus Roizmanbacteria bacterium RIFCSPHIGHO2_01_FULL_39_12b]|uniref:AbiEi antitoxin C-terminal domain-containing protein n=1 Tax=Candidatus Roizmanbacteria bacterium RIFCSPHIGHO2_01_FULL_39_12b TaxID=1802030 RepID=A0A1F7GBF9_9BACT|nr:MAG: hypothetical protein A2690_03180 [Candidatus Roizmanbacteria bacterium RIFCSPHIGHO2_01_FULL_39_12b]
MYKIDKLLKQDQKLFHTGDLALLWGITNKNTLYTAVKRYVQKGILIPIHKGFYAVVALDQINPSRIAIGFLHRFAYVSCETVLLKNNIIFQSPNYITLITDISKSFSVAGYEFKVRKMKDQYLHNDFAVHNINGVLTANLERSVADMLYFNPHYHFDNRAGIDWKKVKQIQKEVGYT